MHRDKSRLAGVVLAALGAAAAAQPPVGEAGPSEETRASSPNYAIHWIVLDANGGGTATSAGYRGQITLGQSPIGVSVGAAGKAELGFWFSDRNDLFGDGFETGDTTAWSATVGGG